MELGNWPVQAGWYLAGVATAAGVLWLRRSDARRGEEMQPGVDPYLLPDPALRWLLRSHGGVGVWISEPSQTEGDEHRWQRVLADARLSAAQLEMIEERLRSARERSGSGVERIEPGTLLFGSTGGIAAGLLLPPDASRPTLQEASEDLVRLLEGMARRPMLARLTQDAEGSVESIGSIGLRLAYQLERILNAEVLVAAAQGESVKVIGVSGRADRRLMDNFAVVGSPLFQVARGDIPRISTIADPLGGIVSDRRARPAPALVLPIKNGEVLVGAVAFWTDVEAAPIGPVIAEVQEAMRSAGPRLSNALEYEKVQEISILDPLTGIKNRRGLEVEMGKPGIQRGALVYADLDKFMLLNDTLGHPAGDAALVHFSRILHEQIRGGDTAARIGGEEFAVWLPTANLAYGLKIADRIRIKLGTTPWDWQGRTWPLSASFGVAAMPDTSRSIQNLAAQADAALLVAKEGGRNRVEAARGMSGSRDSHAG